ncbi:MAG: hypothetical protein ACTSU3_03065 [Candidatus Thorarchaeota archaeon]
MKKASLSTILEDLKISFKFAGKNIISYVLATFGVLIVSALLLAVVAALIFIPLFFLIGGFENLVTYFESFGGTLTEIEITNIAMGSIMFLVPFLAPLFVAIGSMFGMGREIVESEGTSAEGVFTWYKKKFFSLAGGGMVLFLVVLGPLILSLVVGVVIYGEQFFATAFMHAGTFSISNPVVSGLMLIWFVLSTGLLSMLFPSIIDGYSVVESTKRSIQMSIKYFDRVFGVWMAFLLLFGAFILPIVVVPLTSGLSGALVGIMAVFMIPIMLFLVFVFLPAITIGLTRVYMIITADDDDYEQTPEEDESGPSFIGGV